MPLHPNDIDDRKAAAIAVIVDLAGQLGRAPTQKEYRSAVADRDAPTIGQVLYIFDTWTAAVRAAGLTPNDNKPPRYKDLTDQQIVDEFVSISNSLGRFPTQAEFTNRSQYSIRPYTRRWGNWTGVKRFFVDTHAHRFQFHPSVTERVYRETKGRPLNFDCPMQFEPTNEMETVVLFALMAHRMGYRIRNVRSDFPDAELEREGKRILVEFEYLSSNYLQHGHDLAADCVCICWRKDRDIDPIPVIALEDVLREWAK